MGLTLEFRNEDYAGVAGKTGKLDFARPFPSAPNKFWNDLNDRSYIEIYFDFWPNV